MIATTKLGYLDGGYGRDTSPTDELRPIRIRTDEWVPNLRVPIWKPGSIAGVVRDEAGDPVVGVYVRAIVRLKIQGREEVASGALTVTDDRGAYRLSGLGPGRYIIQVPSVQASLPPGATHRIVPSTNPDAVVEVDEHASSGRRPLSDAATTGERQSDVVSDRVSSGRGAVVTGGHCRARYGDDQSGVDVVISPVPTSRVSGVVQAPPEALTHLTLRLLPAGLESLGQGAEAATALVAPDGQFTFLNVPAGTYTIAAPLRINELIVTTPGQRMYFPFLRVAMAGAGD